MHDVSEFPPKRSNERAPLPQISAGATVGYGVVECVKRSTLRWFGHIARMENEEFVKKVYLSSDGGPSKRGRPFRRWEDRVKEYMSERGVWGNDLERA